MLTLLLLTLTGTWLASAALTYRDAHRGIDALLDAHLAQAARLLVAQAGHELEELDFDEDADTPAGFPHQGCLPGAGGGWDADPALSQRPDDTVCRACPAVSAKRRSATFAGACTPRPMPSVAWSCTWPKTTRHANGSRDASPWAHSLPQLIALPVLGLAIWWVVGRSLRPLRRLADELAHRSPDDVQPLAAGPHARRVDGSRRAARGTPVACS